jgi:hypothetical protein
MTYTALGYLYGRGRREGEGKKGEGGGRNLHIMRSLSSVKYHETY